MNFSQALDSLKNGRKVFRVGWNDTGTFLQLIDSDWINCLCIENYEIASFIAIRTAKDRLSPWMPSHADLLAEDWEILINGQKTDLSNT